MTAFWIVAVATAIAAAFIAGRISRKDAEPLWFYPYTSQLRFYYKTNPPALAATMRVQNITWSSDDGITVILRDENTLFQGRMVVPFFTQQRGFPDEPQ